MRNGLRTLALTILVVMCEVCLSGCAGTTVYEAAVGRNVSKYLPWSEGADGGFAGPSDTFRFTVRREHLNGRTFVSYPHVSHISEGWPFNDRKEDWIDMVEFGVRFEAGH